MPSVACNRAAVELVMMAEFVLELHSRAQSIQECEDPKHGRRTVLCG